TPAPAPLQRKKKARNPAVDGLPGPDYPLGMMTRRKARYTLPGSLLAILSALLAFTTPASASRTFPRDPLPAYADSALLAWKTHEPVVCEEGEPVSEGALLASEAGRLVRASEGAEDAWLSSLSFAASGPSAGALAGRLRLTTIVEPTNRLSVESARSARRTDSPFAASAAEVVDSGVPGWRESRVGHLIRHRYFSPDLGRFLQPDPMGYADSMSLYQGFGNNPGNMADPLGLRVAAGQDPEAIQRVYRELRAEGDSHAEAYGKLVEWYCIVDQGSKADRDYEFWLQMAWNLGAFDVTPKQFGKDVAGGAARAATGTAFMVVRTTPGVLGNPFVTPYVNKAERTLTDKINRAIGANEGSLGYVMGEVYTPVVAGGFVAGRLGQASTVVEDYLGSIRPPSPSTLSQNSVVGQQFDDYVAEVKLKGLDELGQLERQERLPTPDLVPARQYVQPDYTIYNPRGGVAAYADAKTGASIPFDAQAQGLVKWAETTTSKTLIYYTPLGNTPISANLLQYALGHGVRVLQVAVP
ncbi:MAG: RHS repeat-associated core domain-containing protein, partial [Pseudomonadota bacterium]